MKSIPQHCTLQHKNNYGIRAGPDLFRSVSVPWLGGGGGGESVVWQFIVEN